MRTQPCATIKGLADRQGFVSTAIAATSKPMVLADTARPGRRRASIETTQRGDAEEPATVAPAEPEKLEATIRLATVEDSASGVEPPGVAATADPKPETGPESAERQEGDPAVEDPPCDAPPQTAPTDELSDVTGSPQPENAAEISDAEEQAAEDPSVGSATLDAPDEPISSEEPERAAEAITAEPTDHANAVPSAEPSQPTSADASAEPAVAASLDEPETRASLAPVTGETVALDADPELGRSLQPVEPSRPDAPTEATTTDDNGDIKEEEDEEGEPSAPEGAAGSATAEADGSDASNPSLPSAIAAETEDPVEAEARDDSPTTAEKDEVADIDEPPPEAEPAVPNAIGPRKKAAKPAASKKAETTGEAAGASDQDEKPDVAGLADSDIEDDDAETRPAADTAGDAATPPKPEPEPVHLTIDSLEDYELRLPIPVVVRSVGEREFIAEIPDAQISVAGTSVGRAFLELKDEVCSIYEKYRGRKFLTSETQHQMDALSTYIAKSKRNWYVAHH